MEFKEFLLFESRVVLGQKVGDILTAVHDLGSDSKSMGSRNLVRYSEKVVNQIRRILHQHWPREDTKYLKSLQKVAVAIMKAIEEKDDLEAVIGSAGQELEHLAKKLGVPIHRLGVPEKQDQGPEPPEEGNVSEPEQKIQDKLPTPAQPVTTGQFPASDAPLGAPPNLGGF